jgi:spermidine synthase
VPFLWILPLGLYLLTFVLCFDRVKMYPRKTATALMIPALGLMCYALVIDRVELWAQIAIYCGCLFVFCMICHGEVYRLRPPARFLTSFYLFVAAGGAAGGLFVGLLAPLIFQSYAELNWGMWLLCALVFVLHAMEKTKWTFKGRTWRIWPPLLFNVIMMGMVLETVSWNDTRNVVEASRSFYGVLRVREIGENGPLHGFKLMNGGITHGVQFVNRAMKNIPTSYYAQGGGLGVAMQNFPRQKNRRIGVIGLGIGTVAAYARAGDTVRFYEINPEVERLARTRFTYLEQCAGNVEVVIGDARLSMEKEASQQFDILVLDAFSSDAIPTHLLTREAFEIYFRHLRHYGAVAVHISNRHLNLFPVMTGLSKEFGTLMEDIYWRPTTMVSVFSESDWVIISRNQPFMMSPDVLAKATPKPTQDPAHAILWTDDRASLIPILK